MEYDKAVSPLHKDMVVRQSRRRLEWREPLGHRLRLHLQFQWLVSGQTSASKNAGYSAKGRRIPRFLAPLRLSMSADIPELSRRHAIGFFVVAAIELGAVVIAGKMFGFSVADILLLRNDAAALFVIGGYLFVLFGIYLLFKKNSDSS